MKGQPSSIWVTIFVALATLPVKGGTQSFSNKDHDTLQLRQELATSFGQRNRALKAGTSQFIFMSGTYSMTLNRGNRQRTIRMESFQE